MKTEYENHSISSVYECRELVCAELERRGVIDTQKAWSDILAHALKELPNWMRSFARDARSLPPGVDFRGARGYRARAWKDGKTIFDRSGYRSAEAAAAARKAFLEEQEQKENDAEHHASHKPAA